MSELQVDTAAPSKLPAGMGKLQAAASKEDMAFVEQVRQRFEQDFLPRFGSVWQGMLNAKSEEEGDDSGSYVDTTVLYGEFNTITPQSPVDFLDGIANKKAVMIRAGHAEDWTCGCEPPVSYNQVDEIGGNDDRSSHPIDEDIQNTEEPFDGKEGFVVGNSDVGQDDGGDFDDDTSFGFDELRKQLLAESEGSDDEPLGPTNGKARTRFQILDTDDDDDDSDDEDVGNSIVSSDENENDEVSVDRLDDSESDDQQDVIDLVSSDGEDAESDMDEENRWVEPNRRVATTEQPRKKAVKGKLPFQKIRDQLTAAFFGEFDRKAFHGATSNVEILWNKKLTTTAGLTRLRRCKANMTPGVPLKRLACIELSTKVVDSEERLRTTLLHELVHAVVWIVDGVDKPPHGSHFKKWARVAMNRIPDVKVTTTHSYEIDYKYIWKCSNPECTSIVKRHSKSFDTVRYRCGKCEGTFVATHAFGSASRSQCRPSAYNIFVKEQTKGVRETLQRAQKRRGVQNPKVSQSEVMKECARLWRESKKA